MRKAKHADAKLSTFQFQVCLGTLLGDSSLSMPRNGRNYHLSCYHSERQLDWLKIKWQWLQPHTRPIQFCAYKDKRNNKIYRGGRFHTISAPCFTDLANLFYINGQKTITKSLMSKIVHPVALACLICDDGSWDGAGISIASKQFSISENHILGNALTEIFGLSASIMANGNYPHIRITAESVETTFNLCRKYVPETMHYKFGGADYTSCLVGKIEKTCPICGNTFMSYKSSNQRYCGRKCANIGRPKGYTVRRQTALCRRCGSEFLRYNKRVKVCSDCRGKPFPDEKCIVCGNQVRRHGKKCCSQRCATIAGHIARGHNITAIP